MKIIEKYLMSIKKNKSILQYNIIPEILRKKMVAYCSNEIYR